MPTAAASISGWILGTAVAALVVLTAAAAFVALSVTGWSLWGGLAQNEAAGNKRSEEFWAAGRAPILVLQAEQDRVAPAHEAGIPLRDEFPERVTLVEVPEAGHALLPEQPDAIARALVTFLRSIDR